MLALRSARTSQRAVPWGPSIYVSESHNPWFNLAYEDWLFRKTEPDQRILYLYRNSPSVIIGRNQNPWKEIDLHRLRELGIPFVRRKSGGGTVYHDLGNTNYCVFVPREEFDRRSNAELVTAGLNELDVPAFVNERHDIVVDGFKMSFRYLPDVLDFHVSGSAFKLVNKRAYHHGTMLIDAQLGTLRGVLGSKKEAMVTKGVASVPSPVRNLREWSTRVNHERFVEVVARQFAEKYALSGEIKRIDEGVLEQNEYVREVVDELKTLSVNSKHGLITSASLSDPPRPLDWWRTASELCRLLEGDRYETLERTREALLRLKGEDRERMETFVEWLRREM
ncbi:hypothetical protein Rhopal_000728-T1 [Rhodotorula paludigena]|uniref:Putative lipoate-protein ligase A n=1 Tax=Rhodotorula paludigena TaxID=86838 RepID=A0AAV5GGQ3_9BASI|nr:hypothetical protein Rhopal_000728-T1 [Rhodotorula paludigena]